MANTAVKTEIIPHPNPLTYALDHDSAEKAVLNLGAVQPSIGLRNRGVDDGHSLKQQEGNVQQPSETIEIRLESQIQEGNESTAADDARLSTAQDSLFTKIRRYLHRKTAAEKAVEDTIRGFHLMKHTTVGNPRDALGIRQLASFIDIDDRHAVFRRFGTSSARVLLQMEIDVTDIEKELSDLDAADAADPKMRLRLQGREDFEGWNNDQRILTMKLEKRLGEYFDFLIKDSQVYKLGPKSERDYMNLYSWMWDWQPIYTSRDDFIFHVDDHISSRRNKESRLEDIIEKFIQNWPTWFKRKLQTPRELRHTMDDEHVDVYSRNRVAGLVRVIAICFVVGLLLLPIMLLSLIPMTDQTKAWTTFGFILMFSIVTHFATDAKIHEVLIGTAGYGAVLVTLLGSVRDGNA